MSRWFTPEEKAASDKLVRQMYGGRCVRCRRPGVRSIHEIIPRSQAPQLAIDPTNRVLLCGECHDLIHRTGTAAAADDLRRLQAIALGMLD